MCFVRFFGTGLLLTPSRYLQTTTCTTCPTTPPLHCKKMRVVRWKLRVYIAINHVFHVFGIFNRVWTALYSSKSLRTCPKLLAGSMRKSLVRGGLENWEIVLEWVFGYCEPRQQSDQSHVFSKSQNCQTSVRVDSPTPREFGTVEISSGGVVLSELGGFEVGKNGKKNQRFQVDLHRGPLK
jgi:hypothetical protein